MSMSPRKIVSGKRESLGHQGGPKMKFKFDRHSISLFFGFLIFLVLVRRFVLTIEDTQNNQDEIIRGNGDYRRKDHEDGRGWKIEQAGKQPVADKPPPPPPPPSPPPPPPPPPPLDIGWEEALERLMNFPAVSRDLPDESVQHIMRERLWTFRCFMRNNKPLVDHWKAVQHMGRNKGILIPAGRSIALTNAFVVLYVLRKTLKCQLPVVLAYYGNDEMSTATREYYARNIENLEFMDLAKLPYPEHHMPLVVPGSDRRSIGYKLKVLALYHAPFRHVIWMDSDSIPLKDPSILLKLKSYQTYGNVFWPDFWQEPVPLWKQLGIEDDPWTSRADGDRWFDNIDEAVPEEESGEAAYDYTEMAYPGDDTFGQSGNDIYADNNPFEDMLENERVKQRMIKRQKQRVKDRNGWPLQAEAGQGALDRFRYWKVLEWLMFLNTHDRFVYKHALGDKDTFRVAFHLAGFAKEYYQTPFSPALPLVDRLIFDPDTKDEVVRFWNLGMLQLHPENGSPLFHHRTADSKFSPQRPPNDNLGPITHVTPSVTQDQASIMIWGRPGDSIYHSSGGSRWGLAQKAVHVVDCGGNTSTLSKADRQKVMELFSRYSESTIRVIEEQGDQNNDENKNPEEAGQGAGEMFDNLLTRKLLEVTSIFGGQPKVGNVSICECVPLELHIADFRCTGRKKVQAEINPYPITVIRVPEDSYIWKVSAAEAEAYKMLPFQETMS